MNEFQRQFIVPVNAEPLGVGASSVVKKCI
jgi:hypothetical protein